MTPVTVEQRDRLVELLATQATEALGADERAEVQALLAEASDVNPDEFDLAAAAVDALPDPLAQRLRVQAEGFRSPRTSGAVAPKAAPRRVPARRWRALPWTIAAASVAGMLYFASPAGEAPRDQARQALLERAADVLQLEWSATEDPLALAGVSGDVVWSNSEQAGYMRFAGLAPNDPAVGQYQLWIFDRAQDERYPVDGGVFDVPSGGEALVPIAAKLPVAQPYLFAITFEKPGGVVVSSRERLVLLASLPS